MKKRIGFVALLVALAAATAFAGTYLPSTIDYSDQLIIQVNSVERRTGGGVQIKYTLLKDVESMKIKIRVNYKGGASETRSNTERLIKKGKTYTANFGMLPAIDYSSVDIWLEDVKMK